MTGDNPVVKLKADQDGYYRVVLGQLGAFNGNGTQYRPEAVKKAFIDRLNRGAMYVEYGRPRVDSLNQLEAHSRNSMVDELRVCGVMLQGGMEVRGEASHLVARFKPMGPMASIVRDMLCDQDETLHFGLRGFTNPNDRSDLRSIVTWDLIPPPVKEDVAMSRTAHSVTVGKRPEPELEIEIRGSRPHIGKSRVMELIQRTLRDHGFTGVTVVSQDNDQQHLTSLHNDELRANDFLKTMPITLIDNNAKLTGAKQ